MLVVRGRVFSGRGEGAKFLELPWVRKQMTEKLGFVPCSGTLNVRLTEGNVSSEESLHKARAIEISPEVGFCRGKCFEAYLTGNLKCAVVVPELANYPEDVIEIVAPVNLRQKLRLKDGDVVEVKIVF